MANGAETDSTYFSSVDSETWTTLGNALASMIDDKIACGAENRATMLALRDALAQDKADHKSNG